MDLSKLRASLPGIAAAAGVAGLLSLTSMAHAQTAYAIANGGNNLIRFNVANPTAATLVAILAVAPLFWMLSTSAP